MYVRKVKVKGKTYYQEVEAYWEEGKKKLRVIRHLGTNPSPGSSLGTKPEEVKLARDQLTSGAEPPPVGEEGPFSVPGAVQLPMIIPMGEVTPTPPYTIREYALSESLAARLGVRSEQVNCWRILGTNGAWWPTAQNPTNFFEFDAAQLQLKELWRTGG